MTKALNPTTLRIYNVLRHRVLNSRKKALIPHGVLGEAVGLPATVLAGPGALTWVVQ